MAALCKTFVLRNEESAKALHGFLKANWRTMAQAGRPLACSVAEHKAKRSANQNNRYWAILREIADNAWLGGKQFSTDAWHYFYAGKYIGEEEAPNGKLVPISTTSLSTAEFTNYMTQIEAHATSELGIELETIR